MSLWRRVGDVIPMSKLLFLTHRRVCGVPVPDVQDALIQGNIRAIPARWCMMLGAGR